MNKAPLFFSSFPFSGFSVSTTSTSLCPKHFANNCLPSPPVPHTDLHGSRKYHRFLTSNFYGHKQLPPPLPISPGHQTPPLLSQQSSPARWETLPLRRGIILSQGHYINAGLGFVRTGFIATFTAVLSSSKSPAIPAPLLRQNLLFFRKYIFFRRRLFQTITSQLVFNKPFKPPQNLRNPYFWSF